MEHNDPWTSTTDAPPPPLSSSDENDHQMAQQRNPLHPLQQEDEAILPRNPELDLSAAIISTPPSILINMPHDILESIFLRVPPHQYSQLLTLCWAANAALTGTFPTTRYIEEVVVKRREIIIPVRYWWDSLVARYKNRRPTGLSWNLACNLGSCYYRCYNTREIRLIEDQAESPTPIPCHAGRLFCPWIECSTWHRWFDGGFVLTFLSNRAPEFENSHNQLCSVCCNPRPDSCSSCMASLLCIKIPITGLYKRLPLIDGRWTSILKCIETKDRDFTVLIAMAADSHDTDREQISFVKTLIYDSVIDSWREIRTYSAYLLRNITVVDTHGVSCRGVMYWLLEGPQHLIVFRLKTENWEILKVREPPPSGRPLGLVACMEQVLMVEAEDTELIIWKLIEENSLDHSRIERGAWLEISRSNPGIFTELRKTQMALHSARSPNGDGILCFEDLVNKTAVTYNVRTNSWGRSSDIHGV